MKSDRQFDWMFHQPMSLSRRSSEYFHKPSPEAIERRKRREELEERRELKRLEKEVWD